MGALGEGAFRVGASCARMGRRVRDDLGECSLRCIRVAKPPAYARKPPVQSGGVVSSQTESYTGLQ